MSLVAEALPAPRSRPMTPATAGGIDVRLHRRWRIGGVLVLAVLNVLDLVTTYAFLDRGVPEGNPIADHLLQTGSAGWVKGALLLALGLAVLRRTPRLSSTCLLWLVNGVYLTVVVVNAMIVAAAG
jgi:hypothetical protein